VRHKPAAAADACFDGEGKKIVEKAAPSGSGTCSTLYPVHGEPRLVAGAPLSNDILKCQLRPLDYAQYHTTFTSTQKERLARIFPDGACDYGKPGVEQVPLGGAYQRYR
jgi:hypothetical protein